MYPTDANRVLPHSVDAEQAVLGSMMKEPKAAEVVLSSLRGIDAFYVPKHKQIFGAALRLEQAGEPIDVHTISDELQKNDTLQQVGGRVYLVETWEQVASTLNVSAYIKIILDHSTSRQLICKCNEIAANCYNQERPVGLIVDDMQQMVYDIAQHRRSGGFELLSGDNTAFLQRVQDYETGEAQKRMVFSGFPTLDRILHGFERGACIIIGGRTSHGKTQLALQICESVAIERKKAVAFFSVEMSRQMLNERLHCSIARIDSEKMKDGQLGADDHDRLARAVSRSGKAKILIDDRSFVTPSQLLVNARKAKVQHGIELLVVDYLQIIQHSLKGEYRERVVADISRRLKGIAKELDIPVLALSQLRRSERGENKLPCLSDLRDSGAIEQDADVVIFVHHELDKAMLVVAKNRNGRTDGGIPMCFDKGHWDELTTRDEYAKGAGRNE